MPNISQHQSAQFTKLMLVGGSGNGKTGSLISLANAGYQLRILDLDNGVDILANLAKDTPAAANIDFITITDKFKNVAGKAVPVNSDVWPRTLKYLENWSNRGETKKGLDSQGKPANVPLQPNEIWDLGRPQDWGPNCILVIDSFTFLCNAAMRYILKLNGRPAGPTWESDWNEAQQLVENLLGMLYSDEFKTNVIVCAHIAVHYEGKGSDKHFVGEFPAAIGKALGPKVGRYFNSMLEIRRSGTGNAVTRSIHTVPQGFLELKNPNPAKVKPKYDIKTGLAEYFKEVRESTPS